MIDYTQNNNKQLVREQLMQGLVHLTFTRANGTVRHMTATLNADRLPPQLADSHARPVNEQLQVVWDTDLNAWRSFRWERLTEAVTA